MNKLMFGRGGDSEGGGNDGPSIPPGVRGWDGEVDVDDTVTTDGA